VLWAGARVNFTFSRLSSASERIATTGAEKYGVSDALVALRQTMPLSGNPLADSAGLEMLECAQSSRHLKRPRLTRVLSPLGATDSGHRASRA
jgi:hypothetical protein